MESWRTVWRDGFAPILPTDGLEALRSALAADDDRLCQGSTTSPPPAMAVQDWPIEAACLVGYCGAAVSGGFADETASGKTTNPNAAKVSEVEEFFAKACFEADQRLGEAAACRWLLNWYDDTPRDEMRAELLAEVEWELNRRETVGTKTALATA
jgi:hypothetical protein